MKKFILFIRLVVMTVISFLASPLRPCRFPVFYDPMARGDVYGDSATKLRTNPVQKVPVNDLGARIRYLNEVYTQSGAGTIGDVIHLPPLPAGAKIIPHLSEVAFSAGNAGATLAIGKTGAATALKAATAIDVAGSFSLTTPADGADDVTLAEGEELIATNATAAIKAGQVIRFRLAFVSNS